MKSEYDLYIGIDPGTKTGYACWNPKLKTFTKIATLKLHWVLEEVLYEHQRWNDNHEPMQIFVRVEDARLRKWFGGNTRGKEQGAGSIKRDCKIWEEFLIDNEIPHEFVDPKRQKGFTKLSKEQFKTITGYIGQTSEHSRDAAMLVFGIK